MMMLMTFLLLQAAAAAPEAASQTAAAQSDDAKIVCRTITITGSRLAGKRYCLSKREWRRMAREGEETARSHQDNYSKQPGNQ